MQKHVKNYFKEFGYDESSFIPCEVCGQKSVDVHHIELRSKFGSKHKDERDHVDNLIALCRRHHEIAHGKESRLYKDGFKLIVSYRKTKTIEVYKEEIKTKDFLLDAIKFRLGELKNENSN